MCFHSQQSKSATELEQRFKAKIENPETKKYQGIYNGFTYPETPVITANNPECIKYFYWGLIPEWSRDEEIRAYTLNARVETIKEKVSFKQVIQNRCLVLVDGFYEWQWLDEKGKKKQKYLITLQDNSLFSFAAIYSVWVNKNTSEIRNTYSIVTTVANELMSEIHNTKKRMPIILNEESEKDWLAKKDISLFSNETVNLKAVPI
jgi:putative SOS response-associated peptidase YedK